MILGSKMTPKVTLFLDRVAFFRTFFATLSEDRLLDASLSHFGSLLAPFWTPLAPFWLPLAPFWTPLAPFGLP